MAKRAARARRGTARWGTVVLPGRAAVPASRPRHGSTRAPAWRVVPLDMLARQARAAARGLRWGGEGRLVTAVVGGDGERP